MLKTFSVRQYRNLNISKMHLKRVNLLVGPNNSGKSNLMEAIRFFSDLVLSKSDGSAFQELLAKRGWDDVLNRNVEKPGEVRMEWVVNTDPAYPDLTYMLNFRVADSTDYRMDLIRDSAKLDLTQRNLSRDASNLVNVLGYLDDKYDFFPVIRNY